MKRALLSVIIAAISLLGSAHPTGQAAPRSDGNIYLPLIARTRENPLHTGIATYYDADGTGTCMFDASPNDLMVAAMNNDEWNSAAYCGAYVQVNGAKGSVIVRVVDQCPECHTGHLDLSPEAFARIDDLIKGHVPITWRVVSPAIAGPIAYHFKEGANQWWTAVQVRNHRNPIAKFEYWNGSQWVNVPRMSYNYFVQDSGMGVGPYTFRVTDMYSNTLTDSGIPFIESGTINGVGQFPPGP
jgi:expansin (peptidoglycan-binding protein)